MPQFAGVELPIDAEPRDERELIEALTPRETEVLRLLAEGLPNKEIAGALGISEHTVKFHLSGDLRQARRDESHRSSRHRYSAGSCHGLSHFESCGEEQWVALGKHVRKRRRLDGSYEATRDCPG